MSDPLDDAIRALFEDGRSGVLVLDREGLIVRANTNLRRLVARRVDLSPTRPGLSVFDEQERERVWSILGPALYGETGGLGDFTTRLEASDPDPDHMVDVSVFPLREADGRVSGLLLRLSDITAQKRLEAQLAHSQKLQVVGQFAGGIAHDFNTLLTAILGASDLVLEREGVDPGTREDVGQIRRSAERGAALVRQILAFGRQQTLQPRVLAVNEAVADLSRMLERLLAAQIQLRLDLETPGRAVRVDPTQFDQVLMNLAVNARDAMPQGGTLTLRTGHATLYRPQSFEHETVPPGRYVTVEVEDNGTGIPRELLPRIFDPFFTTRREQGGSGLGLSTVHGIVRQSAGFLAVESEVGKGTRIRLYFPRYETAEVGASAAEPESSEAAHEPAPDGVAPVTVLLVDDEEAVRRLAERVLARHGWQVLSADSAEAALALLADQRSRDDSPGLSVLVSDLVMPGMDGTALVRTLREQYPGLPAILVSGYAGDRLRDDLEAEQVSFLAKPYTLKALAAEVARVTGAGAAGEAAPDDASRAGTPVSVP